MSEIVLEMRGITKSFGGVHALKGIDFELAKGEIHALLGENGAGKSTLIKVLGGIHKPNEGEILIDGHKVDVTRVQDAQLYGIGIIHQEIVLVPHLSIAENIFLGREPVTRVGLRDIRKMNREAAEMVQKLGLHLDVRKPISELTIAQQQLVEITKAVSFDINILVMDEPTSSLTGEDVKKLFETMHRLQKSGISIIYISHKFEELFQVTDKITVIRDGTYVGTRKTKESTPRELISMMVGREIESLYTRSKQFDGVETEVLRVESFTKDPLFKNVSFLLKKGEILGFSGLVGAGRSELMQTIFGAYKADSGRLFVNNEEVEINSCIKAIEKGIGMVPEDRKGQGLILKNTVGFNLTLANLINLMSNKVFISEKKRKESIKKYMKDLRVKAASDSINVSSLSGGNQQKVVLAKWLSIEPQILILDEPTRGVDVGAKSEIYSIINRLANEGIAIILVSSELPEIINMSDRVCVMKEGELVAQLDKDEMTQENIMHYATGGETLIS